VIKFEGRMEEKGFSFQAFRPLTGHVKTFKRQGNCLSYFHQNLLFASQENA